jgi:hypothetical protein
LGFYYESNPAYTEATRIQQDIQIFNSQQ